jgi:chromosome segregation ATPase
MSDQSKPREFDHPCKETCSGWKQGYECGLQAAEAQISELNERLETVNDTSKFKQMTIHELQGQRDQLRAENEALRKNEMGALGEIDELRAERDAYLDALERIERYHPDTDDAPDANSIAGFVLAKFKRGEG